MFLLHLFITFLYIADGAWESKSSKRKQYPVSPVKKNDLRKRPRIVEYPATSADDCLQVAIDLQEKHLTWSRFFPQMICQFRHPYDDTTWKNHAKALKDVTSSMTAAEACKKQFHCVSLVSFITFVSCPISLIYLSTGILIVWGNTQSSKSHGHQFLIPSCKQQIMHALKTNFLY